MARKIRRPCKYTDLKGKHFHTSIRAARKCALAAKRRKGGPAWSDKELGV
jgi:hypothetical protein